MIIAQKSLRIWLFVRFHVYVVVHVIHTSPIFEILVAFKTIFLRLFRRSFFGVAIMRLKPTMKLEIISL